MPYRFLFIMDPIEAILPDKDTTFALMLAAQRRGHQIHYCEAMDLYTEQGLPGARTHRISVHRAASHFAIESTIAQPLTSFDAILMRKDPPVDTDYIYATQLLSLLKPPLPLLVNAPQALRDYNEKLAALHFPTLTPRTLISRQIPQLQAFLGSLGGQMIIKPLNGCGGTGVLLVRADDRNANTLLEISTNNGNTLIVAQEYLPEIRQGDKRILLVDGAAIGAILRVPRANDHRGNLHVGGTCEPTTLTQRDKEIVSAIGPHLNRNGLFFVGVDVIGEFMTEINVTSPTGIQELSAFDGHDHASDMISLLEARIAVAS